VHPLLISWGRLGPSFVAWMALGALLAVALARTGELGATEALLFVLPLALVYGNICLAAWYVCRAVPLRTSGLVRLFGTHAATAILSSALWMLIARGWIAALGWLVPSAAAGPRLLRQLPLLFVVGVLLFLFASAIHYLLIAFEQSRLAETRALELKVLARESELKALRAQVDPHFLFNSLNSISALTAADPGGPRRMCLLLGDFLRASLRLGAEERIALADEIGLARDFLAIEKVRFGARLHVDLALDEEALAWAVPPLLLQPLVENAVTHGIANLVEGGVVRLEAGIRRGVLEIAIENPCDPGRRRRGAGVGLENVRQRLAMTFGPTARLDTRQDAGRFRVELTLPTAPIADRAAPAAAGLGAARA